MKLFDSHCHLDDKSYSKDIENVIKSAEDNGVVRIMIVGINKKSSQKAVSLAESYTGIFASVGVHPHDASNCTDSALETLRNLAKSSKVKAWGETGLDFNRMYSPKEDQEKWFARQLEIADELNLPVIFHERDSNGRLLDILKENPGNDRKGVVHCFSGNKTELSKYLDLGFYIGITGILTIKTRGAELRGLVPHIPVDRLLIETDAPYLTPAPEKNKTRRNEPAFVKSVFLKLAEVIKEDPGSLADQIWKNTCELFDIEESL
ncbi:MAG: TatD family hydrolase [Deltaproteobacteria bacterium]|nr:TatD family hydrolase [Deltaproteobacteria bacterium]MBW1846475.1 TatD family hydrolase [Deltaproteobacteria bacterium]MBW2179844.1 TatD family hydrolase [Deltaproteobacteria bacterium]MBW2364705.1 TatD family hydrolase [Deltaproteobacteria bacterium]